jgi:hypothetical protein
MSNNPKLLSFDLPLDLQKKIASMNFTEYPPPFVKILTQALGISREEKRDLLGSLHENLRIIRETFGSLTSVIKMTQTFKNLVYYDHKGNSVTYYFLDNEHITQMFLGPSVLYYLPYIRVLELDDPANISLYKYFPKKLNTLVIDNSLKGRKMLGSYLKNIDNVILKHSNLKEIILTKNRVYQGRIEV